MRSEESARPRENATMLRPLASSSSTTTRASARVHLFVFVAMQHLGCEFEGAIAAGDERYRAGG